MRVLFDTNIFIDMLNGHREATVELTHYSDRFISAITNMELRVGETPEEMGILDDILADFTILPVDDGVLAAATQMRKDSIANPPKLKLGDALIAGTAEHYNLPLITRNPRDFKNRGLKVHVPYDLIEMVDLFDPERKKRVNVVANVYPHLQDPPPESTGTSIS
jgi:predicted nucleic acid-binding protein